MDKAMDALASLAEKLGTTVEQMAPHYVEYVWCSGLVGVLVGAFLLFVVTPAAIVTARWGLMGLANPKITSDETRVPASVVGICVSIVAGIAGLIAIGVNAAALLAPEGYAIAEILRSL